MTLTSVLSKQFSIEHVLFRGHSADTTCSNSESQAPESEYWLFVQPVSEHILAGPNSSNQIINF